MRKSVFKKQLTKKVLFYFIIFSFLLAEGCQPLARKFTRKPKKEVVEEELVLVPEEYPLVTSSKDDLYSEAYLFWKSWHDELIEHLVVGGNVKKQIDCIQETIKNLEKMKAFLVEEKGLTLEKYIKQLNELKDKVLRGQLTDSTIYQTKSELERQKREIKDIFAYRQIKDYLR